MLEYLITSKTRVKLLLKFFLNPEMRAYLRSLAEEFGESTNAVRVELNRLTEAGLLESENEGRTKLYQANRKHALFDELHSIVKKYIGIDCVIEEVLRKLGNVELALIIGDYARGIDSGVIELVLAGEIDTEYLTALVKKAESLINRHIHVHISTLPDVRHTYLKCMKDKILIIWDQTREG
ncbi:winged helix-turn-helix domain-containing protein [Aneurinibacillus uraniidurans]|uniref:winged helix-turn-helix domain-containing protein n=1 Tax=Aneurinibacillus uraniidurans TaxID=2966586 RepID=UPI002349E2AE|nr:winged helix-turn-helix domain-containing protein [Aneurinibacillus sp. B1]WCN38090.1 winged helix-turn-helix domain-containing protein [Aneurinibacillus sp. B1]